MSTLIQINLTIDEVEEAVQALIQHEDRLVVRMTRNALGTMAHETARAGMLRARATRLAIQYHADRASKAAAAEVHTVRGEPIGPEGAPYGTTHDMSCPGCQSTPFTASPRSETYWSS